MRKALLLLSALAIVGVGGVFTATPTSAEGVTFELTGGSLAVAEPSTATITGGTVAGTVGTSLTGALGSTVVTDTRGGTTGWFSKVTGTTAFTNGTTVIPVTSIKVWVPGAVSTTGVVVATAGTFLTQATGLALTTSAQTLVTATAVIGNNTATFTPSIAVAIPADATVGTYSGAVTQTVS